MATLPHPPDLSPGQEVPPISGDEYLYRRLLPGPWCRDPENTVIPQRYFMPRAWQSPQRPGDADGISVNRSLLTSLDRASRRPDTGESVPVARFAVADVHRLGLTVRPEPIAADPSHAVIPELNST